MENDVVCVVAIDRNSKQIKTCTSCDRSDSQKYAKYYRNIGYNSKVLTYEELEEMQRKEDEERTKFYEYMWQ